MYKLVNNLVYMIATDLESREVGLCSPAADAQNVLSLMSFIDAFVEMYFSKLVDVVFGSDV